MDKITNKEEIVLNLFWQNGPMFVKELQEHYNDPKPHINTLSTYVRSLEAKGYLAHKEIGGSFQYYPAVEKQDCGQMSVDNIVAKSFGSSYMSLVSCLVHEDKISIAELKELIDIMEKEE
ncbi:MAG: BlaI/MecI/CopY family transcriptional regulator [Bacteroidaceae bacterium]|nr:BlaI/MecI/CopY family transcriptional regulator [Bacteroidaceae bacterium]